MSAFLLAAKMDLTQHANMPIQDLNPQDILTKVSRYNLIRNERMIYIDVHERLAGNLAGNFLAVPNLVNIVAKQEFQGIGETEAEALKDCLSKIKGIDVENLFPRKPDQQ